MGWAFLLGMMAGESARAAQAAIGRTIAGMGLRSDVLSITFTDGTGLDVWDDGQSCCESRYMRTDDDLAYHTGARLIGLELADAPSECDEYGNVHDVQFLLVRTDRGVVSLSNHNEHNGYYGGFLIRCRAVNGLRLSGGPGDADEDDPFGDGG